MKTTIFLFVAVFIFSFSFSQDKPDSVKKYYPGTKILKELGANSNGKISGMWKYFNKKGDLDSVCNYRDGKRNGITETYHSNGNAKSEVRYVNDLKQGEEIIYDLNNKRKERIVWENGKKISSHFYENYSYETDATEIAAPVEAIVQKDPNEVFTVAEQMPEYEGGMSEMYQYIAKHIVYPLRAKEAGITGKCYIRFVVMEDGSVDKVEILRGVPGCPECDKEALRVISSLPKKFKPGKLSGKPVKVYFNLPLNFKID
jgi:TonB family protein